jgi:MFS family permease
MSHGRTQVGYRSNIYNKIDSRYVYYGLVAAQYFSISLTASNGTIYYLMHGITKPWVAYLGLIGSMTIVLCEFPTGVVADKIGPSISVSISLALRGAAALWVIFCYGPAMFSLITVLSSIGYTFFSGASEAWIFNSDHSVKGDIQNFFANSFMINGAAKIVGGAAGAIIASSNADIPFILSGSLLILTAALFVLYILTQSQWRPKTQLKSTSYKPDFLKKGMTDTIKMISADRVLSLITMSGTLFIVFSVIPLIYWQPFFLDAAKSMSALGGIWAVFIGMNLAGSFVSKTSWVRNRSTFLVFKTLIGLCGISLLLSALTNKLLYVSLSSFFAYHFLLGVIGPIRYIIINQRIDGTRRASILSFISFAENFGAMLSFFIFGYLCNIFHLKWILALSTIPLAMAFFLASWIKETGEQVCRP